MGIWNLYPIDDGWLMTSSGMKNYPLHILGIFSSSKKGTSLIGAKNLKGMGFLYGSFPQSIPI